MRYPRSSPRKRGYDTAWDKLSLAFRAANPLCRRCHERGATTKADVTDHIMPKAKGGTNDWSNLQSLCFSCHNSAKQSEERLGYAKGCDANGTPLDPAHPWRQAR